MKLIDLLNCMNDTVVVSITGDSERDIEVYVSRTKLSRVPHNLISLIKDKKVKDVYTLNGIIHITIEK